MHAVKDMSDLVSQQIGMGLLIRHYDRGQGRAATQRGSTSIGEGLGGEKNFDDVQFRAHPSEADVVRICTRLPTRIFHHQEIVFRQIELNAESTPHRHRSLNLLLPYALAARVGIPRAI
ncbi:MAG: hypothetical protein DMF53_17490 [Acidobacteria bacterium]|nr:MAG: hypothetical protein DMF53_17490 [Acidobacteriota bacterium]